MNEREQRPTGAIRHYYAMVTNGLASLYVFGLGIAFIVGMPYPNIYTIALGIAVTGLGVACFHELAQIHRKRQAAIKQTTEARREQASRLLYIPPGHREDQSTSAR